jgi:two-component system, cell cycle response regulator
MAGELDDESTVRKPSGPAVVAAGAEPYLILLQGATIGRMYRLGAPSYEIGRALNVDIQFEDDGVSRLHARIDRKDDGSIRLVDLGSTNGSFVNGTKVEDRTLEDGDVIQFGKNVVLKFTMQSDVEGRYAEQLYEAATRDSLTGLLNRRFFDDQLVKDVAHATRHEGPLSVLVLDLDHFKSVNDTHGHLVGDKVLASLGEIIRDSTRTEDVACRLGGEEFAVVMRGTGWEGARNMAERLRSRVEAHEFSADGKSLKLTVSVGIATLDPPRHGTAGELLEEADKALYRAKNDGRNRVVGGPQPERDLDLVEAMPETPPPVDMKKTIT